MTYLRKHNTRYAKTFGINNLTIDICRFMEGKFQSNFMAIIEKQLYEKSNMLKPCPISVKSCNCVVENSHFSVFISFIQGLLYIRDFCVQEDLPVELLPGFFQIQFISAIRQGRKEIFVSRFNIFFERMKNIPIGLALRD